MPPTPSVRWIWYRPIVCEADLGMKENRAARE